MNTVHVVVPVGIDDPQHPSGGNVYDRRLCRGLAEIGWGVREHQVQGPWPWSDPAAGARLPETLDTVSDGRVVLVDGLVASTAPQVLVPASQRLRVVVLIHMPVGESNPGARESERTVLTSAAAVVTTSHWARQWLLDHYDLPCRQCHVAEPGVELTNPSTATKEPNRLLCVGAVTPPKGHRVLVEALAELDDLPWICQVVGPLDVDPGFVDQLRRQVDRYGLVDRLQLVGPLSGPNLEAAYDGAAVLVAASRSETFGMVVTEAIAHGLPVIAGAVGGVPEALGRTADGRVPGLLVRPGDAAALAGAIRAFLTDDSLACGLRRAARDRREALWPWSHTVDRVARVLTEAGG